MLVFYVWILQHYHHSRVILYQINIEKAPIFFPKNPITYVSLGGIGFSVPINTSLLSLDTETSVIWIAARLFEHVEGWS